MNNHYGFFNSSANNIQGSVQGVYLMASTSSHHGLYIHQSNIRHCLALYSARVLSKHTWINSNNVYIANKENINE